MSEYLDISFMDQDDQHFSDESGKMEAVTAHLTLCRIVGDVKGVELAILEKLVKNLPIKYNDGIFRIESIAQVVDEMKGMVWEIKVRGTFTSKDPNGIEINGWSEEENYVKAEGSSTVGNGSIAQLEL